MRDSEPPVLFSAAGHPGRWRLPGELAAGGRQMHELTALIGQPQNLPPTTWGSYVRRPGDRAAPQRRPPRHLYTLDLSACAALLTEAGAALHPGMASTQLAIFCAWRVRGRPGALVGGAAFILPGLILILVLAALFLEGDPPTWVKAIMPSVGL